MPKSLDGEDLEEQRVFFSDPKKLISALRTQTWHQKWYKLKAYIELMDSWSDNVDQKQLLRDVESLLDEAWRDGQQRGLDWALVELRRYQSGLPLTPPDARIAIKAMIEIIRKRIERL